MSEREKSLVERELIGGWNLEEEKNFLEITRIDINGEEFSHSDTEYTPPEKYSTTVKLIIYPEDKQIVVKPRHLDVYGKEVDINFGLSQIEKINVGIVDNKTLSFIAIKFTSTDGYPYVNQFFFNNDGTPGGVNLGQFSGPSWPSNRPQILNLEMFNEITALGVNLDTETTASLLKGARILTTPAKTEVI